MINLPDLPTLLRVTKTQLKLCTHTYEYDKSTRSQASRQQTTWETHDEIYFCYHAGKRWHKIHIQTQVRKKLYLIGFLSLINGVLSQPVHKPRHQLSRLPLWFGTLYGTWLDMRFGTCGGLLCKASDFLTLKVCKMDKSIKVIQGVIVNCENVFSSKIHNGRFQTEALN